jgi:membrane protease YdiL (CAAX protease family)
MWIRSGPPIRLDPWFFGLWVLFSLVPGYGLLRAAQQLNVEGAAYGLVAIIGAFGLTYALLAMRPANVRQLGLCILTCCFIFLLLLLLNLRNWQVPPLLPGLVLGAENLLILTPVTFLVEEVFFRGVLDTYLHQGVQGSSWLSASYLSALWGLWHLPLFHGLYLPVLHWGQLPDIMAALLVVHIAVGVPLSIWWRRSGNLAVPGTTHALVDTIRNVLVGVPG